MPATNISNKQPQIIILVDGEAHILSVADIRMLANGAEFHGCHASLVRVLARGLLDRIEGAK